MSVASGKIVLYKYSFFPFLFLETSGQVDMFSQRLTISGQYLDGCCVASLPLTVTSFTETVLRFLNPLVYDVLTLAAHIITQVSK